MRVDFSEAPVKRAEQLNFTIIHHAGRAGDHAISPTVRLVPTPVRPAPDDDRGDAGASNPPIANHPQLARSSGASVFLHPGTPAQSFLSKLWKRSPYCPESAKYGFVVRENGRWVHKKKVGGD